MYAASFMRYAAWATAQHPSTHCFSMVLTEFFRAIESKSYLYFLVSIASYSFFETMSRRASLLFDALPSRRWFWLGFWFWIKHTTPYPLLVRFLREQEQKSFFTHSKSLFWEEIPQKDNLLASMVPNVALELARAAVVGSLHIYFIMRTRLRHSSSPAPSQH